MRMRPRASAACAVVVLFECFLVARPSSADVQACVDAHRDGQVQRDRSEFMAAYDRFSSCMNEDCPGPIRAECAEFRQKLDSAMPTVIFVARDASGNDLPDTVVEVDGRPLLRGLTGRAVPVDPGPRRFAFTGPSGERAEVTVVVSEGVKGREVIARFAKRAEPERAPDAKPARPESPEAEPAGPSRTVAYVLAGGGVAALGAFVYFGMSGRARFDDLKTSCAPHCSEAAADGVTARYVMADVSLVAAAALLGGAAYFYFVPPGGSEPPAVGVAGRF
jgi:hypothetical protein